MRNAERVKINHKKMSSHYQLSKRAAQRQFSLAILKLGSLVTPTFMKFVAEKSKQATRYDQKTNKIKMKV